ncbi:uncharacterized protein LOC108161291 isoform X8 [Drosophila miranda]|uniref:uncharacterized protein LOC108161291 isoform X8 n=1 Tax=Drosophila miranda TaxID=7229 RepID=UPI00143F077F|nr:uncharacterized protein LOC108161291 isoform X8 [Drosophila miranda]
MEKNKRRSSLRQPPARDDDQAAAAGTQNCVLKRRISFSGKKSVREFVNTEEPHYWEDSYELSDCTNGEDNSREKAPKAGPSQQAPTADKENIPLQFEHPSTRIDMTLNLRTSIDVPRSVPRESLFAESLSLSSMGRDKLKDTLYSYPITDKTIDLMQISSKVREDCSELSSFEMEHMKTQPTKSVGDSFMDITPLGYTGPGTSAAAAVPVPAEKENVDPVQKLVHMEVEEGQKEIQRQADISFDWDMNDSDARDRLPSHGFFQTEPNNSTINYLGDESVLIPFDMISGENISKNLNFRQLNDDLEAGKIKVFANGPRTPCTDRKVKQMFWHGLDEDQDQDQDPMDINIRSIKPRATLNFSENMTMSPLAQTAPVAAVAEPLPREKLKIPDDKRKYRVSQADEMMLDNTNFLAHAKLGDETQSRNSSKVLSRRESTYESSEIDLGTPKRNSSCRQDFQPSTMQEAPSKHSKPRQTIHLPVEMEQDVFQLEEAAAAIPPGRASASARRTISLNESMDQENIVDEKATVIQSEDNVPRKHTISKRRETLLMEESMEEDIISPLKELHLKGNAHPAKGPKSRHTLHLAEPLEEDEVHPRNAAATEAISKDRRHLAEAVQEHLQMGNQRSKARQTILQEEPIEEDVDNAATGAIRNEAVQQNLPMGNQRSKARQTILQAEPIEEDVTATGAIQNKSFQPNLQIGNQRSKARQTILQSEAIVEDVDDAATGAIRKDYEHLAEAGQKHLPMGYQRSKARQTILQSEPIEEDVDDAATGAIRKEALQQNLPMGNQRPKARQTILQAAAIEEEFDYAATGAMRKDRKQLAESVQEHLPMANQRSKASQSILQSEAIEEDVDEDTGAIRKDYEHLAEAGQKHLPMGYQRSKARQTILQSEPIEEGDDDAATGAIRKEALQQNLPMGNQRPKARQTILQAAAIEEEFDYAATGAMRKDRKQLAESVQEHLPMANQRSKASQSILQSEAIEEDVDEDTGAIRKDYEHLAEAGQKHLPMGYQRSKARQTILQSEPIEKDVDDEATGAIRKEALQQNLPMGNQRPKARQTILQAAAIEEEFDYAATGAMRKDYEHLVEAVQEHHVPTGDRSSRSRQTLLTAVPIEEDHSIAYQSFKPRNTHESREESVAFKSKNTLMLAELIENMTAFRTSKARQTLLLATSMEEEEQLREPPLEKSTKVAPNRGSRAEQTLIMSESMEEEAEKADDFQSPLQSTGAPPELLPITPMLKQNRSGSLNSMKEFEQFEKDTNQAATPRSPLRKISALLRKFSSMGESMKMSLEGDASECGTPIRHSGDAKRLFAHLTPNLPEAKKRNTHLFGDMEMEQEMEASIAIKEVTAAVDMNFDLTLQPVRGLIGEHMSRPTVFEERPITVSDVSAYFQNQSGKVKKEPAEGTIEVEHGEKRDTCPRDSGSSTDRSFKSYAPTNKRFINLSGDTTIFSAAIVETIDVDQPENNQIDNVRLSLVSTLADEPDTDEEAPVEDAVALPKQPEPQPQPEPEPEPCQEQQESSRVVAAGSSASCRRCANCRRSLSEPRLSNDSFVLPTQPQWDLTREIEMLRRVRAKPNLDDVHKYWQMKEQERRTIALEKELDSSSEASEEEEFSEWDVNEVMATYKGEMERFKRNLADNQEVLQQMLVALEPVETFFDRLHDLLGEQQPNWIFDYQLKVSRKLIFTHRLLTTFRLIVDYETVDDLETAIRVCDINVEQATVILPLQSWTAFEHLLDFQLQLKLPVNLTDSIEGSSVEAFAQFLQRINAICVDILRTFHKLLTVLTATRTSLLRQVNRIVVKKTVRRHIEVDTRTRMEKTDFVIEIGNVEAISFRDILQPKLHFFNENIQFLPTGVAFLEAFLDHPEQYLKV